MNHTVASGQFISQHDVSSGSLVAVLGPDTVTALFGQKNPLGQTIKLKNYRFTVIGTLEAVGSSMMGISMDNVIYVPITTLQTRLFPSARLPERMRCSKSPYGCPARASCRIPRAK